MKVKVFLESAGTFDEREILKKFYEGIKKFENKKSDVFTEQLDVQWAIDTAWDHCDVAVMLGSWKDRARPWHVTRNAIAKNAPMFIVVETPLLGRQVHETNTQHRIGINGFLNHSGTFYVSKHGNERLQKLGITWDGWKDNPNGDIILMLQLPGDASLRSIDIYEFGLWAYKNIRRYSNKNIIIRTHPHHNPKGLDDVHKFISDIALTDDPRVKVVVGSKERTLQDDLKNAYCTVSYSSGSAIDSVLAGIPTIALDPANFTYGISSNHIEHIDGDNIRRAKDEDVKQWLYNLSYSQWSVEEMQIGTVWQHLKPIIDEKIIEAHTTRRKGKR
jgi:hypothetical protein